ncbi:hypothetical protein ACWPKS_10480 [Coraliomargarita sp. W4R72]
MLPYSKVLGAELNFLAICSGALISFTAFGLALRSMAWKQIDRRAKEKNLTFLNEMGVLN